MRIERISNNSIKVYISKRYLQSHGLSVQLLLESSEAFDHLIWDIVDHANIEFGHDFNENQLDISHVFDSTGGIVVTISNSLEANQTNIIPNEDSDNFMMDHFKKLLYSAAESMKKNPHLEKKSSDLPSEENIDTDALVNKIISINSSSNNQTPDIEAFKSMLNNEAISNGNVIPTEPQKNTTSQAVAPSSNIPPQKRVIVLDWDILVFPEFGDMVEFLSRNKNFKTIASSLYSYRGAYYLLLKPNKNNVNLLTKLQSMALDYNATNLPAITFLPLLRERGTVLMENGAISKIIKYFGS